MTFYATYNPYGCNVVNRDGRQANQLRGYSSRWERDRAVDHDPAHMDVVNSNSPLVRRVRRAWKNAGARDYAVFEAFPYMDR